MGSNRTRGTNVYKCLFRVCLVLRVDRRLATGWSPVQGVLQTNWRDNEGPEAINNNNNNNNTDSNVSD
jgi:hypothetical protein